jgi:hypothetical protein
VLDQREEIDALVFRQLERTAQTLEHIVRYAHVAALLEPRVPRCADAGDRSDILAPQPARARARCIRKPDFRRSDARATQSQEFRTLIIDSRPQALARTAHLRLRISLRSRTWHGPAICQWCPRAYYCDCYF